MPYSNVSEVPSYVPKAKRRQWMAVWNDSYSRHSDESRAFAEANAAIKALLEVIGLHKIDATYEDIGEYDEVAEAHLRSEIEVWADYAEGGPTFDPTGDYLCGTCDMRLGSDDCNRVISPISFTTGGCRIYTKGEIREDNPPMPTQLTQIEAAYTERPNLKGFGCKRCTFGSEAKKTDSIGRASWCSFWGLHVFPNACCFKNTSDDDVFAPIKTLKAEGKMGQNKGEFNEPLIFCRLVKVDQAKREVWGVVTCEEPDRDGEICDFDTTVPFYAALVDEMKKASEVNPEGGVNIFPLRAMHGLVAAGKGISIDFRKEAKEIYMGFKVVDDNEWKKVQENVYTGFSQGGRYVKRWKDGDYTRYTAKPGEVSLVDIPCLAAAHFDQVKALKMLSMNNGGYDFIKEDGSTEFRKFSTEVKKGELPTTPGDLPSTPTSPSSVDESNICTCTCEQCSGNNHAGCTCETKCSMSSEVKSLLSILTKKEKKKKGVKYLVTDSDGNGYLPYTRGDGKANHNLMGAAWAALHGGYRGNKYSGPDKAGALKRLKQVYAREGMETPAEKYGRITDLVKQMVEDRINGRAYGYLGKGMYTVGRFANIVEDLGFLWMAIEYERESEGDESPVVDDVKEILEHLLDAVLLYTEEQVEEAKQILVGD